MIQLADIVETPKVVAGLSQPDFILLDNKVPHSIPSFQALGGGEAPSYVIVFIDAVNTEDRRWRTERGHAVQSS